MEATATAYEAEGEQSEPSPPKQLYFVRLNTSERFQHTVFMICFVVLAITGFMLKVPEDVIQRFGNLGQSLFFYRSLLHRAAGALLILVSIYHVYYLLFRPAGRRWLIDMLPRFKDAKDILDNLLYFINVKKAPPEYDRFSYKQKMEYGALIAGNTLMSISGLLLLTESRWDKFVLDLAAVVHSREAVLACLAIIVWHMYEIHLKPHKSPIDKTWITGAIDEAEMKAEYMAHYRKIMADPKLKEIYIKEEKS
jgi:cytochrome b subunit of formate dehydrogenase